MNFGSLTTSIYNSSNLCVSVCLSVCMRPQFLDDRRSDLIETCQEYCRGPADVPFWGLISIGRAVPKLRPFICRPRTRHGAMTSRMTSQLMFIYLFIYFCTIDITILLLRLVWRHNRRWGPEYVPFQSLISFFLIHFSCFPSVSQGLKAVLSQGLN